jgi:tRNA-specific 2-thiouridylase
VASHLGIPYYVLDVQEEFQARVVEPFLDDYQAGRTPNPCISCNNEVKFDLLLRKARSIGAAALATGHYARILRDGGGHRLLRAVDPGKDQSYVLYGLGQEELARARFPLGGWRKEDVRARARELGLVTADKPDSVEICFVTGGDYRELLARRQAGNGGEIRHLDGTLLGRHAGVGNYTVGQRSGLGALPRGIAGPLFVLDIDAAARVVTVGPREALRRELVELGEVSFVAGRPPAESFEAMVRIRYAGELQPARVRVHRGETSATVEPDLPLTAAAPGQAAVLYAGEEVLGGGRIQRQVA